MPHHKTNETETSYDVKMISNIARELDKSRLLLWRLFTSAEVPVWVKTIPFFSLLYWVSPFDALIIPFVGIFPIDDAAVILVGLKLFVELCPKDLVERLRNEINYGSSPEDDDKGEIIDTTYRIIDDD